MVLSKCIFEYSFVGCDGKCWIYRLLLQRISILPLNVKPMNMVYLKRRHISTRLNKTQEKMQYPVINMHGPEFDCYSNSNEKCMDSILLRL